MAKVRTVDGRVLDVLVRDLIGREVIITRGIRNSLGGVPKGTRCKIEGAWRSGFNLEVVACPHCKSKLYVSQVHRDVCRLVDPPEAPREQA